MSKKPVNIPEPCLVKERDMSRCAQGFYCGFCQKNVNDLSRKNIAQVNAFIAENPGACVRVKTRHTRQGKRIGLINRAEVLLDRFRMPALTSFAVTIMLFVSGCHSRKPPVKMGGPRFLKQQPLNNQAGQSG